ncbi:unnamed protein product [Ambrosiozyma monospora]|uniref:Unnamed protein product n=1 Tax=Ambrosiozyma monospora TaxID=43982 RepID=A0ACB5TBX8_AMBMO|nr:unnamed protein product [Ambrosiozyma monospora]
MQMQPPGLHHHHHLQHQQQQQQQQQALHLQQQQQQYQQMHPLQQQIPPQSQQHKPAALPHPSVPASAQVLPNPADAEDADFVKLQEQQAQYAAMYNQVSYQLSKRQNSKVKQEQQPHQFQQLPQQQQQPFSTYGGSTSTEDGSREEMQLTRTDSDTSADEAYSQHLYTKYQQRQSSQSQSQQQQQQQAQSQPQYTHLSMPSASAAAPPPISQPNELAPPIQSTTQPQLQRQQSQIEADEYYTDQLITFFSSDNVPIPQFLLTPPPDFQINNAIDSEGHTPLHWAAALASQNIIHLLISHDADPLILNLAGMNCLSKLIHFTNSYDMRNFKPILGMLRQCLIVPDCKGRTPLHYLVELSEVANKFNCLCYYFEEIVKFVQFQQREAERVNGSDSNSPTASNSKSKSNGSSKNLLKILINHKDNSGQTALHLALKSGVPWFIKSLIQYGADVGLVGGASSIPVSVLNELELERKMKMNRELAPAPVIGVFGGRSASSVGSGSRTVSGNSQGPFTPAAPNADLIVPSAIDGPVSISTFCF